MSTFVALVYQGWLIWRDQMYINVLMGNLKYFLLIDT